MSYIVVEGLDFSGKSSLCEKLAETYKSKLVAEPFDKSPASKHIRSLIRGAILEHAYETQLLIASRIELFTAFNNFANRNSSTYLISDRNFLTNMVYQSQSLVDMNRILTLNVDTLSKYNFDIIPDVLIYMDIPYEVAFERYQNNERKEINNLDNKIMKKETYLSMQTKYEQALDMLRGTYKKVKIIKITHETKFVNLTKLIDDHMRYVDIIPVKKYETLMPQN